MPDYRKTYLALGDSMSIDDYTGVAGGGAVSQFHKYLGRDWTLIDRTFDGCIIEQVPTTDRADLITLTIGGNNCLMVIDTVTEKNIEDILRAHRRLLEQVRKANPDSCFIIGNIYTPDLPLPPQLLDLLEMVNHGIADNAWECGGLLADIHGAFEGHAHEYICGEVEPNLKGASVIASLFSRQYERWSATQK